MRILKINLAILSLASLTTLCQSCLASQENFLNWKKANIEFDNNCSIEVEANERVYKRFVINAFGNSFTLSPKELGKIEGLSLSVLNVVYEKKSTETDKPAVIFRLSNYIFAHPEGKLKTATIQVQKDGITMTEEYLNPPN